MRVSCRKDDPGYATWIENKNVKIYLNGQLVHDAITADDVEGFVLMYQVDENFKHVFKQDDEGHAYACTITLRGRVEIVLPQKERLKLKPECFQEKRKPFELPKRN